MRIAIYGDSLADPNHYKYSLKLNDALSEDDNLRTWTQRLILDGHDVDFFTGMSRHPLWVDEQYQFTKQNYDKRIIRCYNWNKPIFTWTDYDEIVKEDFFDLVPNQAHLHSAKTDKKKETIKAVGYYYKHQFKPEYDARVFKLLIEDWTRDKNTLFISPALVQDRRFGIPSNTRWELNTKLNLVQERKQWLEDIGCTTEQFMNLDPIDSQIWHKHINHIPIEAHYSVYEHVKHWIDTGDATKPIEIKAWDYYSKDCSLCKVMEEKMRMSC